MFNNKNIPIIKSENFFQSKYDEFKRVNNSSDEEKSYSFTTNKLKKDVLNLMLNDDDSHYNIKGKMGDKLEEFFDKGIIVPTFQKKSSYFDTLSMFWSKVRKRQTKVLAFFNPEKNNITLMMSNLRDKNGEIEAKNLTKLLVHEIIHFCARNNHENYKEIYFNTFLKFYTSFFRNLYGKEIFNKIENDKYYKACLYTMMECLFFNEDPKMDSLGGILVWPDAFAAPFHMMKNKLFKGNDKPGEILEKGRAGMKDLLINYQNVGSDEKNVKKYAAIHMGLFFTYQDMFPNKNITTFPYQELIATSEVASIMSEYKYQQNAVDLINSTEIK